MNINNKFEKIITLTVNNIDECWTKLITNQVDKAMKILDTIFMDIDNIISIATKENLSIDTQKLYSSFVKIEQCLKIKDYTLQADILKYEIKPIIKTFNLKS